MSKKLTKRQRIEAARDRVIASIAASTNRDSPYARGYLDALDDVLLLLKGAIPRGNGWWTEEG